MAPSADLLPGNLDLVVLKAISLGDVHGYGVLLRIEQISGGAILVQQGVLYPALYRLEHKGLIAGRWAPRPTIVAHGSINSPRSGVGNSRRSKGAGSVSSMRLRGRSPPRLRRSEMPGPPSWDAVAGLLARARSMC